jgi:hypothetical protein
MEFDELSRKVIGCAIAWSTTTITKTKEIPLVYGFFVLFVSFVVSEREFQAEVAGASMTVSMAASSLSSFTGLTRCSEKPASKLF